MYRDDFDRLQALRARLDAEVDAVGGAERVLPPLDDDIGTVRQPEVELISAAAIHPQPIRWLWPGWLARGKFHLLAGRPGQGKTQIALALAATVTRAGRWPDGSRCEAPGSVVIWSGEDDPADTLVPRLMAAGADLDRAMLVGPVAEGATRRPFDPAYDLPLLAEKLRRLRPALMAVDPVVSATAVDTHKNAEVRRALQPLVNLAAEADCALVGITHLAKGTAGREPVERVVGSIGYSALSRIVLMATKREDPPPGEAPRLLVRAKSNIGGDDGGITYDIEPTEVVPGIRTSRVRWDVPVEGSARELLAQAEAMADDGDGGTLADAIGFLRGLLEDGPLPASEIRRDADAAGHSWRTIHRAADRLGVEKRKEGGGFGGRGAVWRWYLPAEAHKMPTSPQDANTKGLAPCGSLASCGAQEAGVDEEAL